MQRIEVTATVRPYPVDPSQKIVVIPCGGCGSGKSTIVRRMFPTLPVVDADAWKQRHPDYDPKNPGPVHEWSVAQALAECLEAIATGCPGFVYDTTGGSIDRVRKVTEAAQAAGYTIVVVRVWTLRPVAWQRNAKRARTVGSEAFHRTHDKVARVWGQLRSLGHVVRNVASHDPHEAPMLAR